MPNAVSRAVGSRRTAWRRGHAGVGSDYGISDLAGRGYSFEGAAEGELNGRGGWWRTGSINRVWLIHNHPSLSSPDIKIDNGTY
jgi:hypothetical protein